MAIYDYDLIDFENCFGCFNASIEANSDSEALSLIRNKHHLSDDQTIFLRKINIELLAHDIYITPDIKATVEEKKVPTCTLEYRIDKSIKQIKQNKSIEVLADKGRAIKLSGKL